MLRAFFVLSLAIITGSVSASDLIYGTDKTAIAVVEWKGGKLREVQRLKLGVAGTLCFRSKTNKIYVGAKPASAGSAMASVLNVGKDGKVTLERKVSCPGRYCYFALDQTQRFLFGADYGTGKTDVFLLDALGVPHLRQTVFEDKKFAHAVLVSPDNKYVYIPYVKDYNALHQYAFDAATGKLTPLDPPKAEVHPTAGPRHLVKHPKKPFIYSSNEQGLGVSVYEIKKNGTLAYKQSCPANDAKPGPGLSASSIVITPDGKYVFTAQRGFKDAKLNFIHSYKVQKDQTLKPIGKIFCDPIPWIIQLTSDGSHLLVSATKGGTLTSFKIQGNGELVEKAKHGWGAGFRDMIVVGR